MNTQKSDSTLCRKSGSNRCYKKIVCPVDFSYAAKRALKNAITLAERFMAELYILNVYSPVANFSKRFEIDSVA
ncbi:MAG: universal stress protein [Bacteroidales bacterium]|nr:universal stress protein [Bacteroidales bacterium]MBN2821315.1 universal stress protein [Bacteroidales bacterium]